MVAEGNHETDWPSRRPIGASDRWANTPTASGDKFWLVGFLRMRIPLIWLVSAGNTLLTSPLIGDGTYTELLGAAVL